MGWGIAVIILERGGQGWELELTSFRASDNILSADKLISHESQSFNKRSF